MADTTKEVIFKVNTNQAVESIGDLRENVKQYKKQLEEMTIGTEEYTKTLGLLQESQAAIKNAMHASALEGETLDDKMGQLAREAKGLGTSYNALVKQMADLKEEFRSTEDAARRADLGAQIKDINDQLKEMDAMKGDFGRNVGDYFNQTSKALKSIVQDLPSGLGVVKKGLDDVTKSMSLMGKQPIIGIVAMLAPLLNTIVTSLHENKTAMDAVKRAMDALKPVADFFAGILQKIAEWLSTAIDYVLDLAKNSSTSFASIVSGAVGVGNAIVQFLLTPIHNAIDAAKGLGEVFKHVFKGEFKEAANAAKAALGDIRDNFKKGFSFAANFEEGKRIGEEFIAGLEAPSSVEKAKKAGEKIGKAAGKSAAEKYMEWFNKTLNEIDAKSDRRRKWIEDETKAISDGLKSEEDELVAGINAMWEAQFKEEQEALDKQKQARENMVNGMKQGLSATADIFGALADMMESGTDVTESEARKAKNLRIASATIDMFQGATTAYSTAQSLGVPMGPIVGAANAAAVIATGMANIAKIKSQNVSATGSAGATSPTVSTPSITPNVQQVRTITSASEEDRLNQMAYDQQVYILDSQLEANARARQVRVRETSF